MPTGASPIGRTAFQQSNYEKLLVPSSQRRGKPIGRQQQEARAIDVAIALELPNGPVTIPSIVRRILEVFGMSLDEKRVLDDVEYTSGTGKWSDRRDRTTWTLRDNIGRIKRHEHRFSDTDGIVSKVKSQIQKQKPLQRTAVSKKRETVSKVQEVVLSELALELELGLATPDAVDLATPPERVKTTIHRIIRDSELALKVKQVHQHKCQICGHTIQLPNGSLYAEAHHIQPLGEPHNGPDEPGNILVVCPNHHAELDYGVIRIELAELTRANSHAIELRFVEYHNSKVFANYQ